MSLKPPVAPNTPLTTPLAYFNLADYGLVSSGNIDAPLTAAKAAAGANGGTITIPAGDFTSSSPPSCAESRNITIQGTGGVTAGAQASTKITYTGTGTRWLDARSSHGFKLKDLQLLYNQAGFTGTLIDFSHSIAQDSAYMVIENCYIGGSGVRGAGRLLDLDQAITGRFKDCVFAGAADAVRGQASSGRYSNVMTFDNCAFVGQTAQHARNAGESWTFYDCTFENLVTAGGSQAGAGAYTFDAGVVAENLGFVGCWFGDATTAGDWINFKGQGLTVVGCHIGAGNVGIRCDTGSIEGCVVIGNRFDGNNTAGMVIASTGNKHFLVLGNHKAGGTPNILSFGGTAPIASLIQDAATDSYFDVFGLRTIAGAISDGSFSYTPVDGQIAIDSTNAQLAARMGGAWKNIPTTLKSAVSWDPPNVASGASTSTTVTVTGAAAGDYVVISQSGLPGGCILSGQVTAADTVTVTLSNLSGSAQDLNFGTMRVSVFKKI